MPEIKYVTKKYSEDIKIIEIERSTKHYVWVNYKSEWTGKTKLTRMMKQSEYQYYHDTWEEAQQYLIDRYQREVNYHTEQTKRATAALTRVLAMQKPKDE